MLGSPDVIGLLGFEHWMSQNENVTETRRGFILFPKNPGMSFGRDYYQDGIGTRKILLPLEWGWILIGEKPMGGFTPGK